MVVGSIWGTHMHLLLGYYYLNHLVVLNSFPSSSMGLESNPFLFTLGTIPGCKEPNPLYRDMILFSEF